MDRAVAIAAHVAASATTAYPQYPSFTQLKRVAATKKKSPGSEDDYSAAGVFGHGDVLGCLNKARHPSVIRNARDAITLGVSFNLNWRYDLPHPPLFGRQAPKHEVLGGESAPWHDDVLHFNTQSSSQWDGLTHCSHGVQGFYNGHRQESLGIHQWGAITSRAVLLDMARYYKHTSRHPEYSPEKKFAITVADMEACAKHEKISFTPGDILVVRTGWVEYYNSLDQPQRNTLASDFANFAHAGVAANTTTLQFLWNNHFAAVGGDSPAFEQWPFGPRSLHPTLLGLWGMPIGELWDLEAWAARAHAEHKYDAFFSSAVLNVVGGVASPPNATVTM